MLLKFHSFHENQFNETLKIVFDNPCLLFCSVVTNSNVMNGVYKYEYKGNRPTVNVTIKIALFYYNLQRNNIN